MKIWFLFPLCLFWLVISNVNATWNGSNSYQLSCNGNPSKESKKYCQQGIRQDQLDLAEILKTSAKLERQGQFSEAVSAYETGLKTHPGHEELRRRYSLAKSNRDEAAFFSGQKAQDNDLSANENSDNAVKCKTGKAHSAIQACQLALHEDPLRTDVYESLGDAYRSTGRPKEALWAYEKAIELDKNNSKLALKRRALITITGANNNAMPEFTKNPYNGPASSTARSTAMHQESLIATNEPTKTSYVDGDDDLITRMKLLITLRTDNLISDNEFRNRKQALLNSVVNVRQVTSDTLSNFVSQTANPSNTALTPLEVGSFHALVIGNNRYEYLPLLESAVTDAEAIAAMLQDHYGFSVKILTNATRYQILHELSDLRSTLSEHDNLLIYYAGHGYLDKDTDRGYWLPVDAEENNFANWISTADVTDTLSGVMAKHAMVVADSCYSGSLLRTTNIGIYDKQTDRMGFIARLLSKRSRTVLTSGSLEPVLDSGGGKHSIFAKALLTALDDNDSYLEASRLFAQLRQKVVLDSDQTPQYANIRKAGHEGGDFVFVRRH